MKKWVVGVDEVGRGPLAGPVYVCAVAIPKTLFNTAAWKGLTDSKKMTEKSREKWYEHALELRDSGKIRFSATYRSAAEIDAKGIAACIRECVIEAIMNLDLHPKHCEIFLDGGLKAPIEYLQHTIIKGDLHHKAISLASVIAKVTRDALMKKYAKKYPQYSFERNKGYGTKGHIRAVQQSGAVQLHRNSFLKRVIDKS